eukprot:tig00000882_g5253.t1
MLACPSAGPRLSCLSYLVATGGALRVERAGEGVQTDAVLVASKWTHVAVSLIADGTEAVASIYVDGALRGTGTLPAAGGPWTGLIDEVRAWNRSLDTSELSAIVQGRITAALLSDPSLRLFYSFDQDTEGFTAIDRSPAAAFPATFYDAAGSPLSTASPQVQRTVQSATPDRTSSVSCPLAVVPGDSIQCTVAMRRSGLAVTSDASWLRVSASADSSANATLGSLSPGDPSAQAESVKFSVSFPSSNPTTGFFEFFVTVPAGQLGSPIRVFMAAEAINTTAFASSYIQWQTHWGYSTPHPPTWQGEVVFGTFHARRGPNSPYTIPRSSIVVNPSRTTGNVELEWWPPPTAFWYTESLRPDYGASFPFIVKFQADSEIDPTKWDKFCVTRQFSIRVAIGNRSLDTSAYPFSVCAALLDYAYYHKTNVSVTRTFRYLNLWESALLYLPRENTGNAVPSSAVSVGGSFPEGITYYHIVYVDPDNLQTFPFTDPGFKERTSEADPSWGYMQSCECRREWLFGTDLCKIGYNKVMVCMRWVGCFTAYYPILTCLWSLPVGDHDREAVMDLRDTPFAFQTNG